MARLRKAVSYRRIERPYTRVSKYREKGYIRANPHRKIVRYVMGAASKKFPYVLELRSKSELQIRDNSIEAARQSSNRLLEKVVGPSNYILRIRVFPHHILRENPLAAGAGADRFQQGMSQSFGNPYGHAAQVKPGKIMFSFYVNKGQIAFAKEAARKASTKLPMHCAIKVFDIATGKEVVV